MGNLEIVFQGYLHERETIQQGDGEKIRIQKNRKKREKNIVSEDSIIEMFEELSNTLRVDQEHIQKMETINEAMVELYQQIIETNQEQGKQIETFISKIEILTNLLALNGTRSPPQEEYKKRKQNPTEYASFAANSTKIRLLMGARK